MSSTVGASFLIEPIPEDTFVPEDFTAEQREMARAAADFVDGEVMSRLDDIQAKGPEIIPGLLKKAGEIGMLAIEIPEEYGGLGLDKASAMLVSETAAKEASFSISWGAHTGIGTLPIVYFGSEDQREKYLPKLGTGEWLAAYALTEAESGSDALAARASAVRDGDAWVLERHKPCLPNACLAHVVVVFGQLDR